MKTADLSALYYKFVEISMRLLGNNVRRIEKFTNLISSSRGRIFSSRNVLLDGHLTRIFPSRDSEWRRGVLFNYWKMHERNLVALFFFKNKIFSDIQSNVSWTGKEILDRAFESKNGVLLLVPHFGDERSLHIILGMNGYPVDVITSSYPEMPEYVRKCKLANGRKWNTLHFPAENPRWMYRTLQAGRILHYAPTAYAGPGGTWITNFGISVLVPSSPWKLWKRTECHIILASCEQTPDMGFHIQFNKITPPASKEDFAEAIGKATEQLAFQNPSQYEWKNLLIRHRETNTMKRINRIPSDELVLEQSAIYEDSDPTRILSLESANLLGKIPGEYER